MGLMEVTVEILKFMLTSTPLTFSFQRTGKCVVASGENPDIMEDLDWVDVVDEEAQTTIGKWPTSYEKCKCPLIVWKS